MFRLKLNNNGDMNILERKALRKHEGIADMILKKLSSEPF